jgi:glycerate dehydrogenase
MKIVVLDGYTLNPGDISWSGFMSLGELTVYDITDPSDESMAVKRINDAEIVLTNKTPITKTVLDACPGIRYIGVLATGYNVVDTAYAMQKNIVVTNVPSYGTYAVAQMTIALLLEICHNAGAHSESVKAGKWAKSEHYCYWDYPLIELSGKKIGIIGFGRIGRKVADIASALGMEVFACSKTRKLDINDNIKHVEFNELISSSDVISLNCPLTPETERIINKESIAKMKKGVIIINTARGKLIDEWDLADALKNGQVSAAALDVVSEEPIKAGNPLLKCPNCIITPHIAWASLESRQRLMDIAVNNLKAALDGAPVNTVF